LTREENRFEKEKQELGSQLEQATKRVRNLERSLEETQSDRIKLVTQLQSVETELEKTEQSLKQLERQSTNQLAALERQRDAAVSDVQNKLLQTQASNVKLTKEIQDLLADQSRTATRWYAVHFDCALMTAQEGRCKGNDGKVRKDAGGAQGPIGPVARTAAPTE
jgi:chromosome segregation ATPase